jgi:hypothetical protein
MIDKFWQEGSVCVGLANVRAMTHFYKDREDLYKNRSLEDQIYQWIFGCVLF